MFTGNEDQTITLDEAKVLTKRFRDVNPGVELGEYSSKKSIMDILNQPDCVGIRRYNGLNELGKPESVLVGVYANENDIVNGVLCDRSVKSPPYSGINNVLNS